MPPEHAHHHHHHHDHSPRPAEGPGRAVAVIRPNSGLAGDIMVAGLLALLEDGPAELERLLGDLNLGRLRGRVRLAEKKINEVTGAVLEVDLPPEHEHRGLAEIEEFFQAAKVDDEAKSLALKTFRLLAEAEGAVHGLAPEEVHFHEVGALDSLLDIGLAAALWTGLKPARLVSGPLPVRDGVIRCAHGLLPSPAPAVLRLLEGVPVVGLAGRGETVTPTAIALLKAFGAEFGPWPDILIERQSLAYGTKVFEEVPNGAVFVLGREHRLGRR